MIIRIYSYYNHVNHQLSKTSKAAKTKPILNRLAPEGGDSVQAVQTF